jgi:hypothetical protein
MVKESLSGMIVDDSPDDHCPFVRDPNLMEYNETKNESLLERVYFKDMKAIEYQLKSRLNHTDPLIVIRFGPGPERIWIRKNLV